uniref:Sperm acrosome membrane-associated protein 1 n=1 Tax=Geotrypetes seraphini TaxID=260995 RepID=A0A6P8Q7H9_GEOSA|nr:sperm acrosome membrane-associated protein 1 [Geotrypetes seraphini]
MPRHGDSPFGSLVLIMYLLLGVKPVGPQNISNQENSTQTSTPPGIGIREVMLSKGCPGTEAKCLVRVEECRGQVDCGWGKPLFESLESVQLTCVYTAPDSRFIFSWTMLIKDKQPLVLPNDSNILEVKRQAHPIVYQCDTFEGNQLVARIKYVVYTEAEIEIRSRNAGVDIVMVFVLITTIVVFLVLIIGLLFLFLQCKRSTKNLFKSSPEPQKASVSSAPVSYRKPMSVERKSVLRTVTQSETGHSETGRSEMS